MFVAGSECSPGQFRCRNHNCTYSFHVCDLEDNCGDNSDELYCDKHKCEDWEFKCGNHMCIPDGKLFLVESQTMENLYAAILILAEKLNSEL